MLRNRAVLLLICIAGSVLGLHAAAPPTSTVFEMSKDRLFGICKTLVFKAVQTDMATGTLRAEFRDPDKFGKTVKATMAVESLGPSKSSLRIETSKPAAAQAFISSLQRLVDENQQFREIGITSAATPEQIQSIGSYHKSHPTGRRPLLLGSYEQDVRGFDAMPSKTDTPYGHILTSFERVLGAIWGAEARYETLDLLNLPPETTAPLVQVFVEPYDNGDFAPPMSRRIDVVRILILPGGSKDPSQAIQPEWSRPDVSILQNALGAKVTITGLLAAFPAQAFQAGRDVVIVYAAGIGYGSPEVRVPITDTDFLKWRLLRD